MNQDNCEITVPTLSQTPTDIQNSGLETSIGSLSLTSGNIYPFYFDQSTVLVTINYPDITLTRFQGSASSGKSQTTLTGAIGAGKGPASNSTAFTLLAVTVGQASPYVTPNSVAAGTKTILSYNRATVGFLYFYSTIGLATQVRLLKVADDQTIGYNHISLPQACGYMSMAGSYLHCISSQQYIVYKVDATTLGITLVSATQLPVLGIASIGLFCALSDAEGLISDISNPTKIGLRYFKVNQTGFAVNRLAEWSYSDVTMIKPTAEGCYVYGSLQNKSQVVLSVTHYLREAVAQVAYSGAIKPSVATGFGKPDQTLAVVDGVFFGLDSNKLFVQIVDQGNSLSDSNSVELIRAKYNLDIPQISGLSAVVILPSATDMSRFYIMTYTKGSAATTGTFYPIAVTPLALKCTNVVFSDTQELSKDYYFTTALGKNPTYRNETSLLMLLINPKADYNYDLTTRTVALVVLIVTSVIAGGVFVYVGYLQLKEMRDSAKVANASVGSIQVLAPIGHMPISTNTTNNNMLTLHG